MYPIGLNGLQNLIELKLSNNNIKSISSLKSLPSIKEIDISYNQIKSIDGIQNLLTLETLNCNSLKIPLQSNCNP